MNNEPYERAHELARSICSSEVYQQYVRAQQELDKHPEVKEKVRQFRIAQMEVNQAQLVGKDLPSDQVSQLSIDYAKLNRNETAADFFKAEGLFVQMFTDLQQIIQKSIESGFVE